MCSGLDFKFVFYLNLFQLNVQTKQEIQSVSVYFSSCRVFKTKQTRRNKKIIKILIKTVATGFLDLMFILPITLSFLSLNDKILETKMPLFLIESRFVWTKESV